MDVASGATRTAFVACWFIAGWRGYQQARQRLNCRVRAGAMLLTWVVAAWVPTSALVKAGSTVLPARRSLVVKDALVCDCFNRKRSLSVSEDISFFLRARWQPSLKRFLIETAVGPASVHYLQRRRTSSASCVHTTNFPTCRFRSAGVHV